MALHFQAVFFISTHAPRTGSDYPDGRWRCDQMISTHAPRTGSDAEVNNPRPGYTHFNPRSPHGERPICFSCYRKRNKKFQPTLPARGATRMLWSMSSGTRFQPTLPARGATMQFTAADMML